MLVLVGLLSGGAAAMDDGVEAVEIDRETGRRIEYQARTEIELEGVSIDGEIVRPDTRLVGERPPPRFNPLIRLREDWVAEMRQSVDTVR